ncbi:hypothetical protein [Thauera sp. 2A1]|uniref:hypothetical protein n=1 Tax=Thauera sp. 2A1 TaxID=2570191 RepID=UPI001292ACE1|nr:hypothetical protein [Thauera sp. 2A1]KAI5913924.1 hypothetical protein GH664_15880 [Thauera sp. 2A1]
MFTKILVCSLVLGCVSALTSLLDRGVERSLDESVQLPACGEAGGACLAIGGQPRVSTDRFLAMLATH